MPASTALAVALLGLSAVTGAHAEGRHVLLHLRDPSITESSGLAVSQRHPGVLWTHNDGGQVADIEAIDSSGRTVATVQLGGIDPYDPEALAPGTDRRGRPVLFLGDIGDNSQRRPDVSVFRFLDPRHLRDQTVHARWYKFTYPDGPHDAEALMVRPSDGRIFIATKDVFEGHLYRAPAHLRTDRPNRLTKLQGLPPLITDGAFLNDGRLVLRSYLNGYLFDRRLALVASEAMPDQVQGESLAVDGGRLLVGSEGVHSAVWSVPLPSLPAASDTGALASSGAHRLTRPALVALGGAAALVVLVSVTLVRRRRRGVGRRGITGA
jgi:hypothetical protein